MPKSGAGFTEEKCMMEDICCPNLVLNQMNKKELAIWKCEGRK
jgi:hypothetical protein